MKWTELVDLDTPKALKQVMRSHDFLRINSYRHCSELGRLVLNTRISIGLFTWESSS